MSKKDQKANRHGPSSKEGRSQNRRQNSRGDHRKKRPDLKSSNYQNLWLFGRHPVMAAIQNPNRIIKKILLSAKNAQELTKHRHRLMDHTSPLKPEIVSNEEIEGLIPEGSVHQGMALLTTPLPSAGLHQACSIKKDESNMVLVLDQITDPHNVGAIIRSAAAFGARAIVSPDRHSPPESGTLAKSSSGALEALPWVRVTNLSRTLDDLAEMGYWRLGMDGSADLSIKQADFGKNIAIVMGAEGKGLRKGTLKHCDAVIKLPISQTVESLNVSNATAIALYEFSDN